MSSEKKSSEKKLAQEKEKQRLEALQNTEKKFLKGMYGDFFGKSGSSQSAGSRIDALAEKGKMSLPGFRRGQMSFWGGRRRSPHSWASAQTPCSGPTMRSKRCSRF